MRNFQFRLERVLDWYGNQFQVEQARLSVAMASLQEIQQNIARFHAECLSVEHDIIGRRDIPARDFPALGLYRLRARKTEQEFSQELQRREQSVKDQMQRVQEAQRRLRLLEKLRDRRLSEHRYLENKELETLAAESFLAKWERTPGHRTPAAPPTAVALTSHDSSRP